MYAKLLLLLVIIIFFLAWRGNSGSYSALPRCSENLRSVNIEPLSLRQGFRPEFVFVVYQQVLTPLLYHLHLRAVFLAIGPFSLLFPRFSFSPLPGLLYPLLLLSSVYRSGKGC